MTQTSDRNATIDLDALRGCIGRTTEASETATPELVARFCATLDLPAVPADGEPVPPLLHVCLAQPAAPQAGLGPDGHAPRGEFLPDLPLPRRMWAGGDMAFLAPLPVGQRIIRHSRIADVTLRHGRSGPLCFVAVVHTLTGPDRRPLIEERQDIVYRGPEGARASPAEPAPAAPVGEAVRTVTPAPTLLFRYSALTFNGHRIHYDHPYATGVEGYAGLVVHGPLQATLLAQFAAALRGTPPVRFRFRSFAPLCDTGPFRLNAAADGAGLRLWTAVAGGPAAMEARAEW